jgi:hypothetical protein
MSAIWNTLFMPSPLGKEVTRGLEGGDAGRGPPRSDRRDQQKRTFRAVDELKMDFAWRKAGTVVESAGMRTLCGNRTNSSAYCSLEASPIEKNLDSVVSQPVSLEKSRGFLPVNSLLWVLGASLCLLVCGFSFLLFWLFWRVPSGVFHNRNSVFWPSDSPFSLVFRLNSCVQAVFIFGRAIATRKKSPTKIRRALFRIYAKFYLNSAHVSRLRTFLSLGDLKAYAIPLAERFKAIPLNLRKMNEYIRSIVLLNKTKTFCVVKPLHCTFCHFFLHVPQRGFFCANPDHPKIKKTHAQLGLCFRSRSTPC